MSDTSLMKNNSFTLSDKEKVYEMLELVGKQGDEHPSNTIDNFQLILVNDKELNKHIQYNSFSHRPEYVEFDKNGNAKEPRAWEDKDSAECMHYIEKEYNHLYDKNKFRYAFLNVMEMNSYNPVRELIELEEWDGKPRIDNFLKDILKCDQDEDYLREVSRMIFYGGISRVYEPGCKFDYMPILSGDQGIGKSTIIKWLALNESYYREVTTIEGKEGSECIQGGWMCEFSELLAMQRARDIESMKAFITRQVDKYRRPYGEFVSELPRTCIFIGTTNEPDYLKDTTGNRRYLPLYVGLTRGEMFDNEKYIKDYIIACWREALYLFRQGKIYLTIPNKYYEMLEKEREKATVEDLAFNSLDEYLKSKPLGYKVCSKEICKNVFRITENKMNERYYPNLIAKYMVKFRNWEKKAATLLPEYGNQRYWLKVEEDKMEEGDE